MNEATVDHLIPAVPDYLTSLGHSCHYVILLENCSLKRTPARLLSEAEIHIVRLLDLAQQHQQWLMITAVLSLVQWLRRTLYDPAQRKITSRVWSASTVSVLTENCGTSCNKFDDSREEMHIADRKCQLGTGGPLFRCISQNSRFSSAWNGCFCFEAVVGSRLCINLTQTCNINANIDA